MNFKSVKLLGKAINIFCLLFCIVFILIYAYECSLNFHNFPIFDDYEAFFDFNIKYFNSNTFYERVQLIFSQHNEHRIATLRIINLAYYEITGKIDLQAYRIIGLCFYLMSLVFLFVQGEFSIYRFYFYLPVPLFMLSFSFSEIHFLAMESLSHFPMIFFSIGTIYLAIERRLTVLPLFFLLFGVFSNGNGILLIPLIALGLFIQKNYKRLIIWMIVSSLILMMYFYNYESGNTNLNIGDIPHLAKSYLVFLGGIGGFGSIHINLCIGIFALSIILYIMFIKKSFKYELTLSLLMLFYMITYLIICFKRNEYGTQLWQRGAYLINSVLIFTLLYIYLYRTYFKIWTLKNRFKRVCFVFSSIFLIALIYQFKNYRTWIEVLKYNEITTRNEELNFIGNTKELYDDNNRIYNIPLVSRQKIEILSQKKLFDTENIKKNVVCYPYSAPFRKVQPAKTIDNFHFTKVQGIIIKNNPYIRISGVYFGTSFNPSDVQLGLAVNLEGKIKFYKIPKLHSHTSYFRKPLKNKSFFEFLLPKSELGNLPAKISIYEDDRDNLSIPNNWFYISINLKYNNLNYRTKLSILPQTLSYKKDTNIQSSLVEAYNMANKHEIILKCLPLSKTGKPSNYYLVFRNLNGPSLYCQLKPIKSTDNENYLYTNFENHINQQEIKGSVFKLELLTEKDGKVFMSPMKFIYYL